jgi:hypothetical protein
MLFPRTLHGIRLREQLDAIDACIGRYRPAKRDALGIVLATHCRRTVSTTRRHIDDRLDGIGTA